MTTLPEEAVKSADIIQVITDLRLAILQDDDEGLAEHAEHMVQAKELIAKLSASPFLSVQGAAADDCPCTKIQQDETCPVGYPSLLCEICDGKGVVQPSAARELALEEAAQVAEERAKHTTGCNPYYVAIGIAAAIRALSSPDHADTGKLDAVAICKKLAPYLGATETNDWTGLKDDDAISMTVKMRVGDLRTLKAVATDEADAGKVEGDGIERGKFYHHQWPMERLLEARRDGLVDHSGGEAWRYGYSHKDEHGKYDILYRPVKNTTIPARLPSAPASEGAE